MTINNKPRIILNIDNDNAGRHATSRILKLDGFEVLNAATGHEALRHVETVPDLILIDINLPDISGIDICQRIKANPRLFHIPIVQLSDTYTTGDDRTIGLVDVADGCLTRPLEAPVLISMIKAFLHLKTLEQNLNINEGRFQRVFKITPDAILIVDRGRMITQVNPAAESLFGYAASGLQGRNIDGLVPASSRPRLIAHCENFFKHPKPHSVWMDMDLKGCRKDGTEFDVDIMLGALDIDGDISLLCIVRDITERKQTEAQLNETQERLQRVVSVGKVGLWDWDLLTNKVYYSPEWKRQIGYKDTEIAQNFDEWKNRIHPDDRAGALLSIQEYLKGAKTSYEIEFRFRHRDGSYRHILSRGLKWLAEDGTPIRMLGSHVDITERDQLQAQLLQAQKMMSVGQLAGGVAHDFNNLLTIIIGTSELASTSLRKDDPLIESFQQIREAGKRAAALIRQLLAFSRKQVMKMEILDMGILIEDMKNMFKRLIREDINLVIDQTQCMSNIKADRVQIEQVILNLVVNARDAMPSGGTVTISTHLININSEDAKSHPLVPPGSYVMLMVSDTGVGMDEMTQSRVFEPFFTTKELGSGTGLGLATVYGIIAQSGGSIELESKIGQGTTFKIYLPWVDETARMNLPTLSFTAVPGNETILLVEDEKALCQLAQEVLQSAGYTVMTADHGEDALTLLAGHDGPVHLLLTDVVMPGISGRVLATRVAEKYPKIKVLFTSGYTDDAVLRLGVLDSAAQFISTPYPITALTTKVREVLDS
jgi:PAS domain S-box-containing protein